MWTETFAARVFGFALTAQPEFWAHVDRLRLGEGPRDVARLYVRRDQGGRLAAVAEYLRRAGETETESQAKMAVWNVCPAAWFVNGMADPDRPQRSIRRDAMDTITIGALRVVRRGAHRCADHACAVDHGAQLAPDNRTGYCGPCGRRLAHWHGPLEEAERSFFAALVPLVVDDLPSRPRARRVRRSAPPP